MKEYVREYKGNLTFEYACSYFQKHVISNLLNGILFVSLITMNDV